MNFNINFTSAVLSVCLYSSLTVPRTASVHRSISPLLVLYRDIVYVCVEWETYEILNAPCGRIEDTSHGRVGGT